jgi:hypothetical protein
MKPILYAILFMCWPIIPILMAIYIPMKILLVMFVVTCLIGLGALGYTVGSN